MTDPAGFAPDPLDGLRNRRPATAATHCGADCGTRPPSPPAPRPALANRRLGCRAGRVLRRRGRDGRPPRPATGRAHRNSGRSSRRRRPPRPPPPCRLRTRPRPRPSPWNGRRSTPTAAGRNSIARPPSNTYMTTPTRFGPRLLRHRPGRRRGQGPGRLARRRLPADGGQGSPTKGERAMRKERG